MNNNNAICHNKRAAESICVLCQRCTLHNARWKGERRISEEEKCKTMHEWKENTNGTKSIGRKNNYAAIW